MSVCEYWIEYDDDDDGSLFEYCKLKKVRHPSCPCHLHSDNEDKKDELGE